MKYKEFVKPNKNKLILTFVIFTVIFYFIQVTRYCFQTHDYPSSYTECWYKLFNKNVSTNYIIYLSILIFTLSYIISLVFYSLYRKFNKT